MLSRLRGNEAPEHPCGERLPARRAQLEQSLLVTPRHVLRDGEARRRLRFQHPLPKDDDHWAARTHVALCTPHVFLFDPERRLRYRDRIADSRLPELVTVPDLENARSTTWSQDVPCAFPSTQPFGCAIVW